MSSEQRVPVAGVVYKICGRAEWQVAVAGGRYRGSADDARDGFIHLSTADQLAGTAKKHFAGTSDLVVVAFQAARLGANLRWEPSRGGELFPHVHGEIDPNDAIWVKPMPLGPDLVPRLEEGL